MSAPAPTPPPPGAEFDPRAIIARMRQEYWTSVAAPPAPPPVAHVTAVTCEIGPGCYGIAVEGVLQVLKPPLIARLPRTPEFVLGVVNMQGRVLPVFDLRCLLGHGARPLEKDARLVVVRAGDGEVSLRVDRVTGLAELPLPDLTAPPTLGSSVPRAFLRGQLPHGDRLLVLLDHEAILAHCRAALGGKAAP